MQMSTMLEKTSGYAYFNGHNCIIFQQNLYKTLHICYLCVGLALNGLFKRNGATFVFDLGKLTKFTLSWPFAFNFENN